MSEYINDIPPSSQNVRPVEVDRNVQRTPKRITTEYTTTGKLEDIGKESEEGPK